MAEPRKFRGSRPGSTRRAARRSRWRALRGRVVLVDFWTYSCINCLRTLPHLKAWDAAYREAGLTIVGVHSPEFAFERVPDNVRAAVERGSASATRSPSTTTSPPGGRTRTSTGRRSTSSIATGAFVSITSARATYEETEHRIRRAARRDGDGATDVGRRATADSSSRTPESYLGYERLARFANGSVAPDVESDVHASRTARFRSTSSRTAGRWKVEGERIVAGTDARLRLRFQARTSFSCSKARETSTCSSTAGRVRTVRVSGTAAAVHAGAVPEFRQGPARAPLLAGLAATPSPSARTDTARATRRPPRTRRRTRG